MDKHVTIPFRITKKLSTFFFISIVLKNSYLYFLVRIDTFSKLCQTIKTRLETKFNIFLTNKLEEEKLVRTITQHGKEKKKNTFTSRFFLECTPTFKRCPPSNALITSNYPVLHLHAYDHPDRANTQPSRNKLHLITRALIACPHSFTPLPTPPPRSNPRI